MAGSSESRPGPFTTSWLWIMKITRIGLGRHLTGSRVTGQLAFRIKAESSFDRQHIVAQTARNATTRSICTRAMRIRFMNHRKASG